MAITTIWERGSLDTQRNCHVFRWGSQYNMVKRLLEQEKAIYKVLMEDRKTVGLVLSEDTLIVMEAIVKGLQKVSSLTDLLSGKFDGNKESFVICLIRSLLYFV